MSAQPSPFIAWFETLGKNDVGRVGRKNASLGEMVQRLAPQGVRVSGGFVTTAAADRHTACTSSFCASRACAALMFPP